MKAALSAEARAAAAPSLRFRRGMLCLGLIYLAALAAAALAVGFEPDGSPVPRALLRALKAGAILAWQYGFILANRRLVTRGENLDHLWGWANRISLARGILLAALAVRLFEPEAAAWLAWLPAALYAAAAAGDYLDGFVAKRTGTRTELGALLDGELDGEGILLSTALAVQYGRLPAIFLAVGLAKPLYSAYLRIHCLAGGRIRDLPHSYLRRRLAGFQMGVAAVVLLPVSDRAAAILAATLTGLPFLAGFLRDALAASGRIDPDGLRYQVWKGRIGRALFESLPPGLRLAAGATAVVRVFAVARAAMLGREALGPWLPAVQSLPLSARQSWAASLAIAQVLSLGILALGLPRRAFAPAAAVFLLTEVARSAGAGLDGAGAVSLAAVLLLFILRPAEAKP